MKKITAIALGLVLALGLTACGSANKTSSNAGTTASNNNEAKQTAQASEKDTNADSTTDTVANADENTAQGGKTLVVYYSASGNTKRVAEDIAEAAGADLFEIVPTEVYTSDDLNWTNADSRVSREHDDESLRDVPLTSTEVENWADYDTVFIGYPKMEYSL